MIPLAGRQAGNSLGSCFVEGHARGAQPTRDKAGDVGMANVPIKRAMERVPGGMMIVPLLIGSMVATFVPELPRTFGSFTGALFTGALPILAVFYVCMGATIDVSTTPYVLKK